MTDAIMTATYGIRGMGKSSLTKKQVQQMDRVLVFDPQGEYAYLPGFRSVAWSDLGSAIRKPKFKLSYKPKRGTAIHALHKIAANLLALQEPYADWIARGRPGKAPMPQMTLVVEEMAISYPSEKLPVDMWGMKEMCERGRHAGITLIGTTQRPATISTIFRGNCEEWNCFRLDLVNDVDAICKYIGNEYREKIRDLAQGEYLHYQDRKATVEKLPKP